MNDTHLLSTKQCTYCQQQKPLSEFRKRTGKRSKGQSRRGACRECRKQRQNIDLTLAAGPIPVQPDTIQSPSLAVKERSKQGKPSSTVASSPQSNPNQRIRGLEQRRKHSHSQGAKLSPEDPTQLIPSAKGKILMRGHSDKGRRWHQEIDYELAVTLVREHAAIVVNRRTIRRIYSNKDFRAYILTRDNYTCYFCGSYGDTIDHLLPRAKGGHTTPDNCVCACTLCNQTKADQSVEDFMSR
ncbi:HNH endonuclease signature motif containing protein [Paenibacillus sp. FSL R5-0887]|jgi:hypothetical protein|uniref:HNH endonuclease n=1 Tax=Paenibacillus TaxID=44249 RepID=UPI00096FAE21|nr:HNH endonuclease signature motif containing protein [Paenibacillus odorifer]OMD57429.1 restriction endonuclease [Paenibacillus odorifer]